MGKQKKQSGLFNLDLGGGFDVDLSGSKGAFNIGGLMGGGGKKRGRPKLNEYRVLVGYGDGNRREHWDTVKAKTPTEAIKIAKAEELEIVKGSKKRLVTGKDWKAYKI